MSALIGRMVDELAQVFVWRAVVERVTGERDRNAQGALVRQACESLVLHYDEEDEAPPRARRRRAAARPAPALVRRVRRGGGGLRPWPCRSTSARSTSCWARRPDDEAAVPMPVRRREGRPAGLLLEAVARGDRGDRPDRRIWLEQDRSPTATPWLAPPSFVTALKDQVLGDAPR
jgi:hypothetical protein